MLEVFSADHKMDTENSSSKIGNQICQKSMNYIYTSRPTVTKEQLNGYKHLPSSTAEASAQTVFPLPRQSQVVPGNPVLPFQTSPTHTVQ